jgi:hypothetical protein
LTNESETAYNVSGESFKAIHSSLYGLMAAPPGHRVTKVAFTWTVAGLVESLTAYEGETALFTLAFAWNPDSTLQSVERADA